ncbi:atherin-like [Phalacrocorax carbo]|uniref:atherin-like n=1 Tax=Phalacrocorax carbo TaxID=9209 RepID=UPI003119E891
MRGGNAPPRSPAGTHTGRSPASAPAPHGGRGGFRSPPHSCPQSSAAGGGRPVGWRSRRRGAPRPGQAWGPPSPVPAVPRPLASRLVTALQSPQPRFETPRRGLCRTPPSCSLTVPGRAARVAECRDAVCARRNAWPRRGGVRSEPSQEDQSSVNMNKVDLENHIT